MPLSPCQSQFPLTGFTVLAFMLLQQAIKDNVDKQETLQPYKMKELGSLS